MEFPIEFPKCPNCGSEERVAELAFQEAERMGIKREDTFPAMTRGIALLQNPQKVAGLTIKAAVYYFDICAKCGLNRCVRAEIADLPMQFPMQQGGGMQQGGLDFKGGRPGLS